MSELTEMKPLIRKIEDRIVINSIFPRLASENAFLREILDDLKKATGHDPVTNNERILGEMNAPKNGKEVRNGK